jgi:hypothetical protein
MFDFSQSSAVTTTLHTYPNFLNKGNDPLRMQVPNYFGYPLVFVDADENLVMANDVTTPLNPLVTLVEHEKLEKTSFDMNVSQRSHEKNRPGKWCALESIVRHGIVNCLLTHTP